MNSVCQESSTFSSSRLCPMSLDTPIVLTKKELQQKCKKSKKKKQFEWLSTTHIFNIKMAFFCTILSFRSDFYPSNILCLLATHDSP